MDTEAPVRVRKGRQPRYGAKMEHKFSFSVPAVLWRRIHERKALRQAQQPEVQVPASQVVIEDLADLYGIDLLK